MAAAVGPAGSGVTALVVQANPEVAGFLCRQLDAVDVEARAVASAGAAREQLAKARFDVVVSEFELPEGAGLRLAEEVRRRWPATATIAFAAQHDRAVAAAAIARGMDDYISRPLIDQRVELAVARALRRRDERVAALTGVDETREHPPAADGQRAEEILERLGRAGRFRDEETAEHVERMSRTCALIAGRLGSSQAKCAALRAASALHDIGKVGVPDSVLRKPGKLNAEERSAVEAHAQIGHDILLGSDDYVVKLAATIALTHHERWDGSGYPRGLAADAIPLEGRIAAVADVFDALTHDRIYRSAFSVPEALSTMRAEVGRQFDPQAFDAFEAVLPEIEQIGMRYPDSGQSDDRPGLFVGPERPVRVLLLEQHPAIARGLELLLRRDGLEVAGSARSVADAEQLLRRRDADVAILSVEGQRDGWLELVPAAKQRGVRVLLYTSDVGAEAARAVGADGAVAKSTNPTEFIEAIRATARGETYQDPRPDTPAAEQPHAQLTAREAEIVALLSLGLSGEQIAERLFISPATVQTHIRNARERTGAKTRSHLVALVSEAG